MMGAGIAAGAQPAIEVENLRVSFGGFHAVDGVSLTVPIGERRAIIGPNGAGKTTLMRVIGGALRPAGGRVACLGQDITHLPEHRRSHLGIARTYQITNLFRHLTVLENVCLGVLGLSPRKWVSRRPLSRFPDIQEKAMGHLEAVGLGHRAQELVANLSYGEQRQLELAVALAGDPKVLLLDEPAAGLSPAERQAMSEQITEIPRDITVIMVEHNMDLVMAFADRVTVLHHGKIVADGTPGEIRTNSEVRSVYLGGS